MKLLNLPDGATVVRVTERALWRDCRRKWKYSYLDKIQPKNRPVGARELGTALHASLEAYYLSYMGSDTMDSRKKNLWAAWDVAKLGLDFEQLELGEGMLNGYLKKWDENDSQNVKPIGVELKLYAQIPDTGIWLSGTIDTLVEVKFEGLEIWDHKGYANPYSAAEIEFDDQTTAYLWLCQQNGIFPRRAQYNMLRKKLPTIPDKLKNGGLSKDKRIATDYATYMQAIVDNGLNPEDYIDILSLLGDADFFRRETLYRTKAQISEFEKWLPYEVSEMHREGIPLYPNQRMHECRFCDFSKLCSVENHRGDLKLTMALEYEPTPERV